MNNEIYDENEFFKTASGQTKYCSKCKNCKKSCKQSYHVEIIACPKFELKERKK